MTEYDNNNRGVLFKNDRKEKDSHADYQGNAEVNGVAYWLSAWIKDGKNGKFMSLSFKPKDEARAATAAPKQSIKSEMDDEIPFAPEFR